MLPSSFRRMFLAVTHDVESVDGTDGGTEVHRKSRRKEDRDLSFYRSHFTYSDVHSVHHESLVRVYYHVQYNGKCGIFVSTSQFNTTWLQLVTAFRHSTDIKEYN